MVLLRRLACFSLHKYISKQLAWALLQSLACLYMLLIALPRLRSLGSVRRRAASRGAAAALRRRCKPEHHARWSLQGSYYGKAGTLLNLAPF